MLMTSAAMTAQEAETGSYSPLRLTLVPIPRSAFVATKYSQR